MHAVQQCLPPVQNQLIIPVSAATRKHDTMSIGATSVQERAHSPTPASTLVSTRRVATAAKPPSTPSAGATHLPWAAGECGAPPHCNTPAGEFDTSRVSSATRNTFLTNIAKYNFKYFMTMHQCDIMMIISTTVYEDKCIYYSMKVVNLLHVSVTFCGHLQGRVFIFLYLYIGFVVFVTYPS